MLQYRANKRVFKSLRKLSMVTLGSLKLSGNEFQADGPATEKARRPYVCNRWRGRTRSRRLADRKCCREVTSETGRQTSTKYCRAWPCMQLCIMMQSLYVTRSGTLSQCSSVCSKGLGRTCVCQWSHEPQHSSVVEACQSSLLAHPPEERYISRRVTTQRSGRVSLLTACRVNAGNAAAAEASRNLRRWRWRSVDQG